ncbi:MAG: metallophosphoesterase [Acidimicrobiales bacterium]
MTPALTGVAIVAAAVGITVLMWRTRRDRVTVAWVALAVAVVGAAAVAALVPLRILGLDVFGIVHLIYLCAVVSVPLVGLVTLALIPARRATVGAVVGATVLIAAAPLGWYMTHIAPFDMRVETVKVLLPGTDLDEPVRIAVLADLQTAGVGDHERRAIRAVIASDPDIVLIPGDLFQGSDDEFDDEVGELRHLLRDLDAPSGVFVTRGDCDGGDRVDRAVAGSGITILDDRVVPVDVRGTTVRIGGTRLDYGSESADLVRRQLTSAPADDITILVSHRPDTVLELPSEAGVDLTVAGHTHGGQVSLPGFGPLMTLSDVPRDVAAGGLHTISGNRLYVSPGIGVERGQAPQMRFLVRPTVGVLDLGG